MIQQVTGREVACIVWSAESKKLRVTLGTDTYVVRSGRIVAQTPTAEMKRK